MKSIGIMLKGLSEEELLDWVGNTIYSRGKSYVDSVSELSCTEDGRLVAWVSGSEEYVTSVMRDGKGNFEFTCTCPYDQGGACKHVVAVLLAATEQLKKKQEIPLLEAEDDLYLELSEYLEDGQGVADDHDGGNVSAKKLDGEPGGIRLMLQEKSRDELLDIVVGLARDFPAVPRWLHEKDQMKTGKIDKLVRSLSKEIRNLTAVDAWSSHWDDYAQLPDYSNVQQKLQALFDGGHADAVISLGEELWERGNEQVGNSNDEGETASEIAGCMQIVLKALPFTRLSPQEQLVWLFDHLQKDQFDLLEGSDKLLDDPCYTIQHWRELAAFLEMRLKQMSVPQPDRWRDKFRRRTVMTQLTETYRRGQEMEKVIPLLEREAEPCWEYETLVDHLLDSGEFDRARYWCIEGYGKTIEHVAGIASALQRRLRQLAEKEGKSDLVAAYRAQDFFESPSVETYKDLCQAAEKIGLWSVVRETALGYLQSGNKPFDSGMKGAEWILPQPEVSRPKPPEKTRLKLFPNLAILIDIAILEERSDDVVALFKELSKTSMCGRAISEQVAQAVSRSHPDISLKIWMITVSNLISEVKTHAYQEASGYLCKMREIYRQTDRLDEWNAMLVELRTRHKAKRRLIEILNELASS
ncbi:MAG: SWIM zinc finger domain-containing protein [Chlorobiaceae bacterium]|nr:SWIM zinc finger domain-containing protein [Chlorobiaceae bacterium]